MRSTRVTSFVRSRYEGFGAEGDEGAGVPALVDVLVDDEVSEGDDVAEVAEADGESAPLELFGRWDIVDARGGVGLTNWCWITRLEPYARFADDTAADCCCC